MPRSKRRSGARRARYAFDPDMLSRICTMEEEDFAAEYDMKTTEISERLGPDNIYHFKDNGAKILAVAHLDTVADRDDRNAIFVESKKYGPMVWSRALDDRLGAYIILELMPKLGITHDVLLTTGEESGRSTASFFYTEKDYHWIIEFDRHGTDVVMYDFESAATRKAVHTAGMTVGVGSFSDICYMEDLGIAAFNWGTGYHNEHSPTAHAYLNETFRMMGGYLRFHAMHANTRMLHEPEPKKYYGGGYGYGGSYRWEGDDCQFCDSLNSVNLDTQICSVCRMCADCELYADNCTCYLPYYLRNRTVETRAIEAGETTATTGLDPADVLDAGEREVA